MIETDDNFPDDITLKDAVMLAIWIIKDDDKFYTQMVNLICKYF